MTVSHFPCRLLSDTPQQACVWSTWTGFWQWVYSTQLKAWEVLKESEWWNQTEVRSCLRWIYYTGARVGPRRLLISCQAALLFMCVLRMCDVCMQLQRERRDQWSTRTDPPPDPLNHLHACIHHNSQEAATRWDSDTQIKTVPDQNVNQWIYEG